MDELELDASIKEAEEEYAQNGQLYDAREALEALRKKYFE